MQFSAAEQRGWIFEALKWFFSKEIMTICDVCCATDFFIGFEKFQERIEKRWFHLDFIENKKQIQVQG